MIPVCSLRGSQPCLHPCFPLLGAHNADMGSPSPGQLSPWMKCTQWVPWPQASAMLAVTRCYRVTAAAESGHPASKDGGRVSTPRFHSCVRVHTTPGDSQAALHRQKSSPGIASCLVPHLGIANGLREPCWASLTDSPVLCLKRGHRVLSLHPRKILGGANAHPLQGL